MLFQQNCGELTDTCLDLTLQSKSGLKELIVRLEDSASARQQVDLINSFLVAHIYGNNLAVDKGLDFAVRQIVQAKSLASLKDIRRQLNISERTFERKFSDHVGVAPKFFARICQFRAPWYNYRSSSSRSSPISLSTMAMPINPILSEAFRNSRDLLPPGLSNRWGNLNCMSVLFYFLDRCQSTFALS